MTRSDDARLSLNMATSLGYRQEPVFIGSGSTYLPTLIRLARDAARELELELRGLPPLWCFEDRLFARLVPQFIDDIATYYRFQRADLGDFFTRQQLKTLDRELVERYVTLPSVRASTPQSGRQAQAPSPPVGARGSLLTELTSARVLAESTDVDDGVA